MAGGRLPVAESLQIAMLLAEQMRQLHETGSAHGRLAPSVVAIEGNAVQLLPPHDGDTLPYSAPEVLRGGVPDARSDIFSFGAIVFEMLTGRKACEQVLPLGSGSPAVDRLVNGCVTPSPDSRYQHVQKLMLELRLLFSAARRANPGMLPAFTPPVAPTPFAPPPMAPPNPLYTYAAAPPPPPLYTPAPPMPTANAIQELESRIGARLQEQERTIANVAHVANEVLKALREQQSSAAAAPPPPMPLSTPTRSYSRPTGYSMLDEAPVGNRTDKMIDLIGDKLSRMDLVVSSLVDRVQKMEDIFDQFDTDAAALRDSVTRDIGRFDRALKAQGTAIESARTAMGQTDDLVERVVEALDSLQAMFVTASEEHSMAS
jgi:eukaryotic-like serine/threonine-protein kinase